MKSRDNLRANYSISYFIQQIEHLIKEIIIHFDKLYLWPASSPMPMVQPDEDGTTCAFAAATESQ